MNAPSIHIFDTPNHTAEAFAAYLHEKVSAHANEYSKFHLALSGGNTPAMLFQLLASKYREQMPWETVHFYWSDERCVPPDDKQSNYGMAQSMLFSALAIPEDNIHRIRGEAPAEQECKRYGGMLASDLPMAYEFPVFDMILLGLGEDGHTASIFPDQMELLYSKSICATARHPETGQVRISLTGKTINAAKSIAFLVTGRNKARIIKEVAKEKKQFYPASHIVPDNGELRWYFDQAAASFGFRGKG